MILRIQFSQINGTEAQPSSSDAQLGRLCDGLPTLLAAWMGALGLRCPRHTLEEVLGVQSWWTWNFLAVVAPLQGITHWGYPPEGGVGVTPARCSHACFWGWTAQPFCGACAGSQLCQPRCQGAAAVAGTSAWQGGQAGGGITAPQVTMLLLLPLSWPGAVPCCRLRRKQAAVCPLLFPLCQLVLFSWWAGVTLKITLGKKSNSAFVVFNLRQTVSARDFEMFFFPSHQLFSNRALYWDPGTQSVFPALMFLVPLFIPFQTFHRVSGLSYTTPLGHQFSALCCTILHHLPGLCWGLLLACKR